MSYQLKSKASFLQYLNAANASALVEADLDFSNPKVVAGTWREGQTAHNTAIQLSAKASAAYQGNKVITYDRLNLASLANIAGVKIVANNPNSTYDILNNLKYFTGVDLTSDDVEDLPYVTVGSDRAIVLSAKPNSVGWYGSVQFTVVPGGAPLDASLTTTNLLGLNYPTNNPGADTMASVYLYGYDFTAYTSDLINLVSGALADADATKIMNMLKAKDVSAGKTLWNVDSGSTAWSLQGATIVSNGLNSSSLPTNQNYKYVLAIDLRGAVTIPTGRLYFHYNDPFNPNDF